MTKLEKDVERDLRFMVEKHGGLCVKWVCPGWSGVPDRIILLPGGHVFFAETKRPKGGKVSGLQRWWAEKLRGMGFLFVFVFNTPEVETLELVIQDTVGRCMK